jgi:leucyl aminopeptidase
MAGMHRDKCGAAFVAGFFKTLSLLKPSGLKVYVTNFINNFNKSEYILYLKFLKGTLCLARNSVGEESYVADELIASRAKRIVRIGNTDAEGRMVMADPLCEAKEMALNEVNPFLFTIATLTGHVIRAYGPAYTV